jgi:hypothetical protein
MRKISQLILGNMLKSTLKDFEISIKRGFARPIRRNWEFKVHEAIRAMNEGDCFDVPHVSAYQQTISAARKIGAKFSCLKLDGQEGYRLWLEVAPSR